MKIIALVNAIGLMEYVCRVKKAFGDQLALMSAHQIVKEVAT